MFKSWFSIERNKRVAFYIMLVLAIGFAAFAAFFHLDSAGVDSWDEARHGINAYEMLKNGSWIVNTYRYQPDYWNLKPPLSFWAILLDFRLFGTTVLALRFYSAVSIFATVLLVSRFVCKRYGRTACLVVTALLACENMLYRYHFGRNGDADALFCLLCTLSVLSAFWAQTQKRWLFLSGLCFSLAFLDKSWHACILLVIIGLFLLGSRQLFHLGARIWAGMLACAFVPVIGWAVWRYTADGTAFFRGMIDRDLLARSSRPLEGHGGDVLYYVTLTLLQNALGALFFAALCLLVVWLAARRGRLSAAMRKDALLLVLWIVIPFVFFSIAATKYSWYIIPTVVPLSVFCAVVCGYAWTHAVSVLSRIFAAALVVAAAVAVLINVKDTVYSVMNGSIPADQQFLRGPVTQDARGKTAYIVHDNGNAQWMQNEIYVGEAYADLRCLDGGITAFLQHPGSVAIISTRVYSEQQARADSVRILAQKDGYLLLAN